ncbi:MAG: type II toxin-antitoxin system RelE/ParE family toxin [Candidatus Nanohaloarchaea archaeon]|nr:type II toxin-antitoxin system RelE/ParE family toxin [Candidatus Nanohaloarchaea archaeon]
MSKYEVRLSPEAKSFIEKLDGQRKDRILSRLKRLESDPEHFGERRGDFWVLKIGRSGFRASFNIEEDKKIVKVHLIEKRGSSGYQRKFYE